MSGKLWLSCLFNTQPSKHLFNQWICCWTWMPTKKTCHQLWICRLSNWYPIRCWKKMHRKGASQKCMWPLFWLLDRQKLHQRNTDPLKYTRELFVLSKLSYNSCKLNNCVSVWTTEQVSKCDTVLLESVELIEPVSFIIANFKIKRAHTALHELKSGRTAHRVELGSLTDFALSCTTHQDVESEMPFWINKSL